MISKFVSHARRGFSLVISLIILTLLSVLVVGFLSTTQLDRATAHAFLGKSQAELAAEVAVTQAISQLREHITQYPDSVTYWETLNTGGVTAPTPVEGTMLYFYDRTPPNALDSASPPAQRYVLPLMSRGVDPQTRQLLPAVPVVDKLHVFDTPINASAHTYSNSLPWRFTTDHDAQGKIANSNAIDINRSRFNGDSEGWVGSPPLIGGGVRSSPQQFNARWIELKENGNANGKTIGRFAFWIEDESFKLNLNSVGPDPRGSELTESAKLKTDFSAVPTPAPLPKQLAAFIPTQGLLRSVKAPSSIDLDTTAKNINNFRLALLNGQVPDIRSFNQLAISNSGITPFALADDTKFLATVSSSSLNLTRQGSQRLNLNKLGFDRPNLTPADKKTKLGEVVETIRFHSPRFGQRFYRSPNSTSPTILNSEPVTPSHRNIYLNKIAANICDYIDPDYLPTILIDGGGSDVNRRAALYPSRKPIAGMFSGDGPNPIWAQGKDSSPFLQEAVVRFRSDARNSRFSLKVDYYLEFWNMTDKPVTAAELSGRPSTQPGQPFDTFVEIIDAPGWVAVGGSDAGNWLYATNAAAGGGAGDVDDGRRLTIDLSTQVRAGQNPSGPVVPLIFQPGVCTVITTDPEQLTNTTDTSRYSPMWVGGSYQANTYYCPNLTGKREFTGALKPGTTAIKPQFRDTTAKVSDYRTAVYMGNNSGYLDSQSFAVSINVNGVSDSTTSTTLPPRDITFGGSLLGNSGTPSETGDPRTNNEQLNIYRYGSGGMGGEPDQTRYANPSDPTNPTIASPKFSLGFPNWAYVNPDAAYPWPDYYKAWDKNTTSTLRLSDLPNEKTAPTFVLNGRLTSIGQLGDIFDPARVVTSVGAQGVAGARGGGRTFKIGQPDDRIDQTTANPVSNQWAAWRLTDFFSINSDLKLPGTININGIARDNGAALRAAFYGLTIQGVVRAPSSNSTIKSSAMEGADWKLNSDEAAALGIQQVILSAIDRMTRNDPSKSATNLGLSYFGPFAERGELSQLELFNTGSKLISDKNGAAIDMNSAFDRTRETIFRRLVELTTTRGSVFSVYAIGESIVEDPITKQQRVTGSHREKVTFKLVPKTATNADFSFSESQEFDPDNANSIKQRFVSPDHYDVQIIQVSS